MCCRCQPILESVSFKGFSNFCDLYRISAGFLNLGTPLARHKKQFMPVARTTTTIASAVIAFFLFVASAFIPLILFISQQETHGHKGTRAQGHKERVEELVAAAGAGRVAKAAIRIRRELQGHNDNDVTRKRR